MKTVLSIAGSDPTTGAGIQSDCLTLYAHKVFPLTVTTAITSQNAEGVHSVHPIPTAIILDQLKVLLETHTPSAIKIGMIGEEETALELFPYLNRYFQKIGHSIPIVWDPIINSSNEISLNTKETVNTIKDHFLQMIYLVTPNQEEFDHLFHDFEDHQDLPCHVLLKGGHSDFNDRLLTKDNKKYIFYGEKIHAPFHHGTGCTLSSAISAHLAKGKSLLESIEKSKSYVKKALSHPIYFQDKGGCMRK